jgi:hypothetical protein
MEGFPMDLRCSSLKNRFCVATALLVAMGMTPTFAQQGVVIDWSTHHVIFSNPGSEMDALMNGKRVEWQQLTNNPRFRMQQLKRSPAWAHRLDNAVRVNPESDNATRVSDDGGTGLGGLWTVPIAPAGSGTALGQSPAFYGSSFTVASCADYVLFPVDVDGKSGTGTGQANFVGFKNLYVGTCTGTVPTVAFAYYVGTGSVQTSPALSLDGTQVAFVESITNGSHFHVFTLGTTGNNGTGYKSPDPAHTIVDNGTTVISAVTNNATDVYFTLHGNVSVTESSPFIDFSHNVAYVGDDSGNLHLFTGVFEGGTLAEVTTGGWPFSVVSTGSRMLTGPDYDSGSGHVVVGASNGNLYCVSIAITGSGSEATYTPTRCSTASISVANGASTSGAVLDTPIVDGTAERVFSEAEATSSGGTTSILMQSDVNLDNVVRASMGNGGTDLHNGDFDNLYFNAGPGTYNVGHMYFCGNATGSARPTLRRIGFDSAGEMNSTRDSETFRLINGSTTGTSVDCTPLTEVFNGTTDFMFLGVRGHGAPSGCETGTTHEACVMGFDVTSSFPTAAASALSLGGQGDGASGIVIDNISTQAGASQVYFSNLQNGDATQASQSALK